MNIPFASIVVSVNENMKVVWRPREKKWPVFWYLACAGVAGGTAAVVTNPLDVIKTKLQTQNCTYGGYFTEEVVEADIKYNNFV